MIPVTLGQPLWFFALLLLPLLGAIYWGQEGKSISRINQLVAPNLRETLLRGVSRGKRAFRFLLTLLAFAALIIALARPQMGFETQEIKRMGRDVVIAIDTSRSMLADDVSPNRLSRAKLAVQDLLRILEGDRVALVAFAGTAFLQAPLTIDYSAVEASLEEMDTSIIPKGGTNIAEAIKVSLQAFGKAEGANKALVIFTDGEELDADALKAATAAKTAGVRIFTVGVGSSAGAMIPITEDSKSTFVRDESGQFVKTRLDEARLKEIADEANGFYVHLENGSNAVQRLLDDGIRKLEEREGSQLTSRRPIERYQWPLGLSIVLFLLALSLSDRRRTVSGTLLACWLILAATPAQAWQGFSFFDKDKRTYNEGYNDYHNEKIEDALKSFSDASASSDVEVRKRAEYNAANSLAILGMKKIEDNRTEAIKKLKESLPHYNESLKLDSNFSDAKDNRDQVEKLIKQLEEQKKDQDKRDDKDKKDQDKKDQNNQQDQDKKDQQKSGDSKDGKDQKDQKNSESKDGQNKDKQQDGKDGKPENKKDQVPQSGQNQQQDRSKGDQKPDPMPTPDEKKEGELKAADRGDKKDEPQPKQKQIGQAEKSEEEKDGKMSPAQARALIESMQSEEQRVDMRDQMNEQPVAKDW